jgi:hypothetical protein
LVSESKTMTRRRASIYREKARRIRQRAERERQGTERRWLIELAQLYERVANKLDPPPKPVGK